MNYADFPRSLRPSALASPESRCQAEGTEGSQGFHPDSTERHAQKKREGEIQMGNERIWGKDTKEMLYSYKDVKVERGMDGNDERGVGGVVSAGQIKSFHLY